MSKYGALWQYIKQNNTEKLLLTFDEVEKICSLPIDHSFLNYKKELTEYVYEVGKISLKNRTVVFKKLP